MITIFIGDLLDQKIILLTSNVILLDQTVILKKKIEITVLYFNIF